jgi:hypothetical protein
VLRRAPPGDTIPGSRFMRPLALSTLSFALLAGSAHAQDYPPANPQPTPVPPSDDDDDDGGDDDDDDDGGSKSDLLTPSTRPHFFVGAIGPSFYGINDAERAPGFRAGVFYRGKLALDYGYHFSGDGEGAAIGVTIEQSFDSNFYVFNPGFKFWYDIMIADMAIYVAPFFKAGYAFGACDGCGTNDHAFNLALGAEGRVVLDDRWMVLFRPIQLDSYFGDFFDQVFVLNYDILIGGGLTF